MDAVVENYRKVLEQSMDAGTDASGSFYANFDDGGLDSVAVGGYSGHVLP